MVGQRTSVFVVFGLNGAVYGTWAPRVPALAERLHAAPGSLGLALFGASIGMVIAASLSGRLAERFGARATMIVSTLCCCVVLPFVGFAPSALVLGFVMAALGASVGALDVTMNIGAVGVERRLKRAIMPVFHAGFSFGGLIASAAAGFAAAHRWAPPRHFIVASVVILVALLVVLPGLPREAPAAGHDEPEPRVAPIRRPVLWLLACIAMCSAIAEGASSDWSALLVVTTQHIGQGAAAFVFAVFSAAMALTRLGGAWVQNRFGATRTLVVGASLAGVGLLVTAVVPVAALAYAGFALAGSGLAASFPIALSLAGAAGKRGGEREVAFVTTLAYSGFLAGPPVIGGIAQLSSLSVSFVVVAVLTALIAPAAVAAGRARHRELTAVTAGH